MSQAALSQWLTGAATPVLDKVRALEDALGMAAGALSRHLGWVPADAEHPGVTFEEFLSGEDRLTADQRAALLTVYRTYVEAADLDAREVLRDLRDESDEALNLALRRGEERGHRDDEARRPGRTA